MRRVPVTTCAWDNEGKYIIGGIRDDFKVVMYVKAKKKNAQGNIMCMRSSSSSNNTPR